MKLQKRNLGQGMTEYLIIVAIIAVAGIGVTSVTSNHIKVGFGRIASALQGKKTEGDYQGVKTKDTEMRSMEDFTYGVDK